MRFSWVSLFVVLPFALSMCGQSSNGDEGDDGGSDDGVDVGGSSNGGAGQGGTRGGSAGASTGGSSSGTNGESGAAGEDGTTGGIGGTVGTGGTAGMGGTGGMSGGSSGTAGGGGCDEAADVLILLDRSASMQDPPELTTETRSKWEIAIPPLVEALSETTAPIRWGLKTFPEGGDVPACAAGTVTAAIDVPIAADNADTVVQAIQATSPDGSSTPTGDAVKQALAYLMNLDSDNPKYVLLVTDGEPSCINVTATSAGTESLEEGRAYAIQALNDALAVGVPTFVVGIGTNKESAINTLNNMASAGGKPAPAANPLDELFYLANSPDGVSSAFQSIVGSTSSCDGI